MGSKVKFFVILIIIGVILGGTGYSVWKDLNPVVEEEEGLSGLYDKKETIYVWYNDDSMTDYIHGAAVLYGDENDVRVIPHLVEESEYLETVNRESVQGDHVPDVFLVSNDSLEKAYLAGLADEIEDSMEIVNLSYFPQVALDAVTYEGKYVAYPLYYETSVLLYNETYLQEWAAQQAANEAAEAGVIYDEETLQNKTAEYMLHAIPDTIDDILNLANTFDTPEQVDGIFKWDVSDIFYNYYFVGNYMNVGGPAGDDKSIKLLAQLHIYGHSLLLVQQRMAGFFELEIFIGNDCRAAVELIAELGTGDLINLTLEGFHTTEFFTFVHG